MKYCVDLNLLERIMLKTVARKAKCTNTNELGFIFNMFDKKHRNFFSLDEFKNVVRLMHPNSEMDYKNVFRAVDVSDNGLIE